ncbi:MAG: NADP-dependent glyceraldehyde-3-phosphate dehydrogenase [Adhaeribacter sp.]
MVVTEKIASIFPREADVPEEYRLAEPLHQQEYLLDGQLHTWEGKSHQVVSPIYTQGPEGLEAQVIGSYPLLTEKEALLALDAAVNAYDNGRGEWPTMSVNERIACIERFTKMLIDRKKDIVKLLMWEIGKSAADSEKEVDRTVEYIYNTIDGLKDLDRESSRFITEQGIIGQIRLSPLGVVLCMGPFNYPLNETFTILIPALIMGNTVLFKPPKHGALLHYPLLQAFADAFPAGVVNTVYGRGNTIVPALMQSGKINVLALIGSSRVADSLKKLHPKTNRLRAILGLDAKNVGIVLPDADLEVTVQECMLGALSFNGQRCTALKILYVHQDVAEDFLERLTREVAKLKVGMPWEKGVQITPLPEPNKPDYLASCLADARAQGARVVNPHGGETNKSFVYPAIVYPVNENMKLFREEQFGPVIPVVPFSSIAEPVDYIIDSDHGQQVSIFGSDADAIAQLIDPLVNQVSRVNINSQCQRGPDSFPFTGRKDSAEGTLSVQDALLSFSIRTIVATKQNDTNKQIINDIVHEHKSKFLSTKFIL